MNRFPGVGRRIRQRLKATGYSYRYTTRDAKTVTYRGKNEGDSKTPKP